MKKGKILLATLIGILVLTGCSKTTVCTIDLDQSSYKINSEYKITYDGNIVKKVETKEVVESSDEDVIDQFEELINDQLEPYSNLKYYEFNVKRASGKLTEEISIDYSKLDIDKFLDINSDAESLFTDGKIIYDDIVSLYKQLGAKCK